MLVTFFQGWEMQETDSLARTKGQDRVSMTSGGRQDTRQGCPYIPICGRTENYV